MDPTLSEIKLSNMLREKYDFLEQLLLGSRQFFINCYFAKSFCTTVTNFSDMLFQVLPIDRLGELS